MRKLHVLSFGNDYHSTFSGGNVGVRSKIAINSFNCPAQGNNPSRLMKAKNFSILAFVVLCLLFGRQTAFGQSQSADSKGEKYWETTSYDEMPAEYRALLEGAPVVDHTGDSKALVTKSEYPEVIREEDSWKLGSAEAYAGKWVLQSKDLRDRKATKGEVLNSGYVVSKEEAMAEITEFQAGKTSLNFMEKGAYSFSTGNFVLNGAAGTYENKLVFENGAVVCQSCAKRKVFEVVQFTGQELVLALPMDDADKPYDLLLYFVKSTR